MTKTHEHRNGDPIEKYDIDGLYRLTDARYDFRTLTHGFTYDDLGNQLSYVANATTKSYLHNKANEITKEDATQVYYDKNGNLTKDAAASPGPYTYYYDRQNKLTKVTKVVDVTETDVAAYAYDALARRIEFIDAVNAVTKRYYLDGQRVIEEYDDAGTPARQRYYVWGNYIDELLVMNADDEAGDPDYTVCHDQLYSAHCLLSKADGSIAERYDYDAYGQPVIYTATAQTPDNDWWDGDEVTATTSAKGLVYLFTGREYDALDTNANLPLQYSRARYYDPATARWLQRDPIGYWDGMSLYQYALSDPVGTVDPSGMYLESLWDLGFLVYDIVTKADAATIALDVLALLTPTPAVAGPARAARAAVKGIKAIDKAADIARASGKGIRIIEKGGRKLMAVKAAKWSAVEFVDTALLKRTYQKALRQHGKRLYKQFKSGALKISKAELRDRAVAAARQKARITLEYVGRRANKVGNAFPKHFAGFGKSKKVVVKMTEGAQPSLWFGNVDDKRALSWIQDAIDDLLHPIGGRPGDIRKLNNHIYDTAVRFPGGKGKMWRPYGYIGASKGKCTTKFKLKLGSNGQIHAYPVL